MMMGGKADDVLGWGGNDDDVGGGKMTRGGGEFHFIKTNNIVYIFNSTKK